MSVGHTKKAGERTKGEAYLILGEADTSALYAKPVRLDTAHDIPYAGGVSTDGRTVYIDHTLYLEVMCAAKVARHLWVTVRGMTGKQIIACWIEHEHTEKAVDDGDNPIDVYKAAHGIATFKEEETTERIIGEGKAQSYEEQIEPGLKRCLARSIQRIRCRTFNPPKDLWCGPILDSPDPSDLILIRGLKAKGVVDAFKHSKSDKAIMYGMAGRNCEDCKHFGKPGKELSPCEVVCGLVRWNRQCQRWVAR